MSITTGATLTLSGDGVYIFRPGGALDPAAVEKLNQAITGYIHDDDTRREILGAAGREDDGSIKDAVNLNNLDDWATFHAQELK
jgi:hypothetical protein